MLLADMDGMPSSLMPIGSSTIKLVVIGPSGVGKTTLRGQYISGRFASGYRATIGADFITKTLAHPSRTGESIVLQIWDTAGQERFSSLSSAFFRGADAVVLCFDANDRKTLHGLLKWWDEFRQRTPVSDEDLEDYCCVVVGNKKDLVREGAESAVSFAEAETFLEELVPIVARSAAQAGSSGQRTPPSPLTERSEASHVPVEFPSKNSSSRPASPLAGLSPGRVRSKSISIVAARRPAHRARQSINASCSPTDRDGASRSRSRSSSRFYSGTMTTTATGMSMYHTPSSSMFDVYHSARASPEPSLSPGGSYVRSRRSTQASTSTVTITPSLFARERQDGDVAPMQELFTDLGPRLFFASAKTGESVSDIFEYVARRVVRRWEREERRMGFGEMENPSVVHLNEGGAERGRQRRGACCPT
ncbi:P-loop containing nucleoside triphosphate hydrolase protein [Schizophyllum amplum]|uniref:P-loop containing nucleoside triphosphate hydrolase protein n=1 Tax=Schizophyllum amplum TaxID=97359 RepID=A0A550C2G6_9AGAR|nr:P-loop containing nucleoside triphosphate hydrolase protein [Auriculariopsis ampla]